MNSQDARLNLIDNHVDRLKLTTDEYIKQRNQEFAHLNNARENVLNFFNTMNQLQPTMQPMQPPMQQPTMQPTQPPKPQPTMRKSSRMKLPRLLPWSNPNKEDNKSKENIGGKSKKNKGGKSKKNKSKKNKGGKSKKNKTKKN